jgi:hypothetical protein
MAISTPDPKWIEYLQHPLVLVGFSIMIFSIIIQYIVAQIKPRAKMVRLMVVMMFVVVLISISIGGIAFFIDSKHANNTTANQQPRQDTTANKMTTGSENVLSTGDKSPAQIIKGNGTSTINYK